MFLCVFFVCVCIIFDTWGYDIVRIWSFFFCVYLYFILFSSKNMRFGAFADIYMAKK